MKLPNVSPVKENAVITSVQDFISEVQKVLSSSSGVFIKLFGKKGGSGYYIEILMDRSKVLAAECREVSSGRSIVGDEVLSLLRELLSGPVIVDIYALDEIGVKLSIAENPEVYSNTPKTPIQEVFGAKIEGLPKPVQKSVQKTMEAPKVEGKPLERPKSLQRPQAKAPGEVEIVIDIPGGEVLEEALREYAKYLLSEAKRVRTLQLDKIVFSGEITGGVVYLNVHLYGHSEGQMREVAEKRMLHAISKYAPVILKIADIKPILKDIKVVLNGKEVVPQQIVERDKEKTGKVDKEGRITLTVIEDVWPYFSAMARTVVGEIQGAGIIVRAASFDVRGRQEFEINAKFVVETDLPRDRVEGVVRDILSRHARELGRTLGRYISVHNIEVEPIERAPAIAPVQPKSAKAAQILQKKEEIEKEVEKLLKQAGVDELTFLMEEKKKESEQTLLRSRIEPAMETLKARLHTELKLIPRVTFKWLKLNWDVRNGTVYVSIEASFLKENISGLFGSFSGVDEDRLKQDVRDTILRVIRDISKEYSIPIKLQKLSIIVR